MEAFESFVALTLEVEGLVVSEAVKFPAKRQTKTPAYEEITCARDAGSAHHGSTLPERAGR